ncbi:MAG: S1 RNA-binding domain-containing protein, partial [Acidobacteriota bacterium]
MFVSEKSKEAEVPPSPEKTTSPTNEAQPSDHSPENADNASTEAGKPEIVAANTDTKEDPASTGTETEPTQQPAPEIPTETEPEKPRPHTVSAEQSSGHADASINKSLENPAKQEAGSEPEEKLPDQESTEESSKDQTAPPEPAATLTQAPSVAPLTAPEPEESQKIDKSVQAEDALPSDSPEDWLERTRRVLKDLIVKHKVQAVAIGAGTHARELESSLRHIITEEDLGDIMIAAVNDAGIAIYSSSRIAREEFPDWAPSDRCAVSLARRLQDPLSELVKIDPKLIGVGQYQHDVDQKELHRKLLRTVQACVNKVGVNINEADDSLLRYVSGCNDKIARRITTYRNNTGAFSTRESIPAAIGLDPVIFEQAAAFLRIPDGDNILDRTAIHPESYPVVEQMASSLAIQVSELIGNREKIEALKLEDFATETAGIPTLKDIREELLKPGKDPRKKFKLPKFRTDVTDMSQLNEGMALEGIVTNVTNFGAFVDIGVRQDGLVHLSQMSNRFIRDPREAVKVGDIVQVKVISVEPETKRIGLSMKALLPSTSKKRRKQQRHAPGKPRAGKKPAKHASDK